MKIQKLFTHNLRNDAHFQFHTEFRDLTVKETATVGISQWAAELQTRNAAFEALVKERFDESAHKTDIVLKEARAELDDAYRSMVERVNALMIVEGVADYESFAKTLNAIIAKYAVRKHHHSSEPRSPRFKDGQDKTQTQNEGNQQ